MPLTNINAVAKMSAFLEWFFLDVVLSPIVVVLLAIHSHLANHFLHRFHFLPSFLAYFYLPISFISTYTRTDRQRDIERRTDIERNRKLNRDRYETKQWFYRPDGNGQGMVNQSAREWSRESVREWSGNGQSAGEWSIKPDGNGQSIWCLKTPHPP